MQRRLTAINGPPLGDIRTMGRGDTLWLDAEVEKRKDWGHYADAITAAVSRGAEIRRRWEL